jgi:hypothetical protein
MLQKVPVFCDFPLRNRRFGDLIMDNSLPPIQPFDQHRQLCAEEPGGDTIIGSVAKRTFRVRRFA